MYLHTDIYHRSVLTGWQRLLIYGEVIRWQCCLSHINKQCRVEHFIFVVNMFDVNAVLWHE